MTDEATIPELASRIRTIDRELDGLEREREDSLILGMKASMGAAGAAHLAQDVLDRRRRDLLLQREALVARLRARVDPTSS